MIFVVQAVCCSDGEHCCPANTECDVAAGKCTSGTLSFPFIPRRTAPSALQTSNALSTEVDGVICPDKSTCPNGSTCCKMDQGYGCCMSVDVSNIRFVNQLINSHVMQVHYSLQAPLIFRPCVARTTCTAAARVTSAITRDTAVSRKTRTRCYLSSRRFRQPLRK